MKKSNKYAELTDPEYSKLIEDIDNFETNFYANLTGTDKYEIIPTVLDDGSHLNREQYALIKAECTRLGLKIIYQIQLRDGTTIFINPENMKIGYIHEGVH